MRHIEGFLHPCRVVATLGVDLVRFLGASLRSRTALAAEHLFLRKQLVLYRERQVKPRRASDGMRLAVVLLAHCVAWREALTIGQPTTLLRWHRQAFRLLWRWRSRSRGTARWGARCGWRRWCALRLGGPGDTGRT